MTISEHLNGPIDVDATLHDIAAERVDDDETHDPWGGANLAWFDDTVLKDVNEP